MQLVQYFSDGTISFNWDQLPENIREKTELRDKIYKELQERMKPNQFVTTRALYDLNRYAIERLRSEIKNPCSPQKMH